MQDFEKESSMGTQEILDVRKTGALEEVVLNRPDRLNALNQPLTDALLAYFTSKKRDADTRVILISGAGRAFCSGADLKAAGQPDRLRDGPNGDWVLRDLLKAMRTCPQPVIALVHGAAAGGGLAIALACDVIVAGESATFHPAFIKIGLSGSELGVSWRLQRTIGISRAREMLLTGRPMNAADALQCGLVSKVVPDAELHAHGMGLAEDMLKAAPDALRISKRTFDATLEIASYDAAMELEERGQIQMIRAGRASQSEVKEK
jgi:enoyl-CoA hydratase/carnithine racemase